MLLDRSDGSATMDLYRAALGPVHADYYLKAFTRFDAAGKTGPSWNWMAALLTVNWLIFRRLWIPLLAYVGALTAALLLLFGIGRLVFQLDESSQWILLAAGVMTAVLVPGAFGNTWLYTACTRKMEGALAASANWEEACVLLASSAVQRKHMGALAAGNLVLGAALATLVLVLPDSGALPLHTSKMEQAREGSGAALGPMASGLAAQSVAASASASAPAPAPVPTSSAPANVLAPAAQAALPSRASQGLVQAEPPVAVTRPAVAANLTAASTSPAPVTAPSASAAAIDPAVQLANRASSAATAKPSRSDLQAQAASAKKEKTARAKEDKAAKVRAGAASSVTGASGAAAVAAAAGVSANAPESTGKYLINVGLFANANNAHNAYAKLQEAGLPATTQELKSAKGPLTRVRAGPFETQAQAEDAAEKIRALRLEAAVLKP